MRHQKKNKHLGRDSAGRKALVKNLANSLILHEKIKTTLTKGKWLKPTVERMVTRAKSGTLHDRRILLSQLPTENAVKKLMEVVGPKYKDRSGGYLRIIKTEARRGDAASMCVIEFV